VEEGVTPVDVNDQAYQGCADGTYLDIGANHGHYTHKFAEKFRVVYAFEPHPDNMVQLTAYAGSMPAVRLVQCAVADRVGEIDLWIAPHHGGHTVSEKVGKTEIYEYKKDTLKVPCITVDHFVSEQGIDDLVGMKIDVEGAELAVLEGARETMKRFDLRMSLETHDTIDCAAVSAVIKDCGYVVKDLHGNRVERVEINAQYLITKE
jgi:FkbM family methyltransferase